MADAYAEGAAPLVRETLFHVRCEECDKLLAEMVSTPYRLRCPRCKLLNHAGLPGHVKGSGSSLSAEENVAGNSTTSA
jgi:phage FluMu protein Com